MSNDSIQKLQKMLNNECSVQKLRKMLRLVDTEADEAEAIPDFCGIVALMRIKHEIKEVLRRKTDYYYREPNHTHYPCADRMKKFFQSTFFSPDWHLDFVGLSNALEGMTKNGERVIFIDSHDENGNWIKCNKFYEPYLLEKWEEYDYGGEHHSILLLKPVNPAEKSNFRDGFVNYFERRCHCEYDCCGHYNGGAVRMEMLADGCWLIRTAYYQNV